MGHPDATQGENNAVRLAHIVALKAPLVLALCIFVAACTILSVDSNRVGETTERFRELRVVFDPRPPAKVKFVTTVGSLKNDEEFVAPRLWPKIVSVFQVGLRDRFPDLAANYGLKVTPSSSNQLRLRFVGAMLFNPNYINVTGVEVTVDGQLVDALGKSVWHFQTTVKNPSIFTPFDEKIFEKIAVELLEAMKKDRIIGS
jgi:hypothetical protein